MQRVITRFAGTHKSSRPKFKFNYWVYRDLHSRSNSLRPLKTEPEIISKRVSKWQNVKPLSDFLTDSFKRKHDYLRISVTERCNLRCLYCMPEEGVELSPDEKLLSTDEIVQLSKVFVSQGVTKIRLTGGEPTVRKDIIDIFARLKQIKGLKEICMTSNGVSLMRKLPKLVQNGLTGLNLSLDTLVDGKYTLITRRNGLKNVLKSLDVALELGVPKVKINCVVMNNFNEDEILDFVELTKNKPVEVRFIEYMPFDGNRWSDNKMISYKEMFQTIESKYGEKLVSVHDSTNGETAKTWKIDGYQGKVGFITSMTQNFCGTCTRLRITCDGNLKVCLFGNHEVNLKDILRSPNYSEDYLLEVIGKAVKNKKKAHAGIAELKDLPNRPMILIGG